MAAFQKGLAEFGFTDARNVAIEYRWMENSAELPALAAELVRRQVVAIVATDLRATRITKEATDTIPIVFVFGNDKRRQALSRRPSNHLLR